jgi:hypothetical protein
MTNSIGYQDSKKREIIAYRPEQKQVKKTSQETETTVSS